MVLMTLVQSLASIAMMRFRSKYKYTQLGTYGPNSLGDTMNQLQHIPLRIGNHDLIALLSVQPEGAMVAIRPICEAVGIDHNRQRTKLESDPRFTCRHMSSRDSIGRSQTMFCLPVEQVGAWLYSINSNKVKSEVRGALLQFQQTLTKELYAVVVGKISSEKTESLEKQVHFLAQELVELREEMKRNQEQAAKDREMFMAVIAKQQEQIDLHNIMVGQEQSLASVGGKLMNRAKATKYLRDVLHNQ